MAVTSEHSNKHSVDMQHEGISWLSERTSAAPWTNLVSSVDSRTLFLCTLLFLLRICICDPRCCRFVGTSKRNETRSFVYLPEMLPLSVTVSSGKNNPL